MSDKIKVDYSQNCDFDDNSGKNDCWNCVHFLFPIGCMYGEDRTDTRVKKALIVKENDDNE